MKRYSFALASVACLTASISSASESAMLPPTQLAVTIEAGVPGTRVESGKRYMIYVTVRGDGSHSGLLIGEDGLEVHKDLPLRVKDCNDTSLRWPDSTSAQVWTSNDATVAQLVAFSVRLNPCIVVLDLPLVAQSHIPGRPNPGMPN